ncbi:hypothetical protein HD554DRAFT_2035111 [Boletus coccyginus]|nr:hypothetical protein HD554DRAFT_2035111 [Boletus coccyginus]
MALDSKKYKKPSNNINVAATQGWKAKLDTCIRFAQTLESGPVGPQAILYSIPEVNNNNMIDAPQKDVKEFLSTLGDGVMLFDPEDKSEDYEQDIATISSMSNADLDPKSSEMNDAFLQSSLLPLPPPSAMEKKVRSTSMSREGTSTQVHTAQSTYDPQACHKPNGTNSPFKVLSQITYDQLHMLVAKKLKCYSKTLKLQYWLDSNNAKHTATSIQSEQELMLFKMRMCPMLIPPHLANGKPSTHSLKNVLLIPPMPMAQDPVKIHKMVNLAVKTSMSGSK